MSSLTDKYTKNYSASIRIAFDMLGNMSEESAASLVAAEMRSGNKKGGLIDKPLGAGGKKL